jgi:hypothetical protein
MHLKTDIYDLLSKKRVQSKDDYDKKLGILFMVLLYSNMSNDCICITY